MLRQLSVTILRFGVILFKNCHDSVIVVQVPLFFFFSFATYRRFTANSLQVQFALYTFDFMVFETALSCWILWNNFFVAVKEIITEFYYFKDSETQHYHNIYIMSVSWRYADMSEWLTVVRVWFCLFLPCFIEHPVYLWLISLSFLGQCGGAKLVLSCSHIVLTCSWFPAISLATKPLPTILLCHTCMPLAPGNSHENLPCLPLHIFSVARVLLDIFRLF